MCCTDLSITMSGSWKYLFENFYIGRVHLAFPCTRLSKRSLRGLYFRMTLYYDILTRNAHVERTSRIKYNRRNEQYNISYLHCRRNWLRFYLQEFLYKTLPTRPGYKKSQKKINKHDLKLKVRFVPKIMKVRGCSLYV